jgi:quinoprotein glucose dehydrogenase
MVETKTKADAPLSSGHQIYNQICAACHGINREGDPLRTFPTLLGVEKKLKPADVMQLLESGKGVMPSFGFLSKEQKQAVTDHIFGVAPADRGASKEEMVGDALGGEPYTHTGYNRFLDKNGYPAVKPPWGTLNAINLNTGEYEWTVRLGEFEELTKQGIPITGAENYGGPVVTASGLIFIAATKDEKFRAFDQKTGKLLWETKLPAGGYATPSIYQVKGRQYVVIACGGGKMGTKSGDAYVAFALPE